MRKRILDDEDEVEQKNAENWRFQTSTFFKEVEVQPRPFFLLGRGREPHIGHWPTALVPADDGCNTIDVSLSCVGRPAKESRQASYLRLESESIRFEGGIVFRC